MGRVVIDFECSDDFSDIGLLVKPVIFNLVGVLKIFVLTWALQLCHHN